MTLDRAARQPDARATARQTGPRKIVVDGTFGRHLFTVNWAGIRGAKYYLIHVGSAAKCYAYNTGTKVSGTSFSKAYRSMTSGAKNHGIAVQITAFNSDHKLIGVGRTYRARSSGTKTVVHNKTEATSKLKKCAKDGLAAGVATGTATGIVAIASSWIPGIDIGTAATAVTSTIASGVGVTMVCLAFGG